MWKPKSAAKEAPWATTYPSSSCYNCIDLLDRRYCLHWRDVVPEETLNEGCSERNPYPPFESPFGP
jgi:hypothetical protein